MKDKEAEKKYYIICVVTGIVLGVFITLAFLCGFDILPREGYKLNFETLGIWVGSVGSFFAFIYMIKSTKMQIQNNNREVKKQIETQNENVQKQIENSNEEVRKQIEAQSENVQRQIINQNVEGRKPFLAIELRKRLTEESKDNKIQKYNIFSKKAIENPIQQQRTVQYIMDIKNIGYGIASNICVHQLGSVCGKKEMTEGGDCFSVLNLGVNGTAKIAIDIMYYDNREKMKFLPDDDNGELEFDVFYYDLYNNKYGSTIKLNLTQDEKFSPNVLVCCTVNNMC